jgi:hypothetical protein
MNAIKLAANQLKVLTSAVSGEVLLSGSPYQGVAIKGLVAKGLLVKGGPRGGWMITEEGRALVA